MVIVSPIFHSTGWATYGVGAALGNKVVTARRFKAEATLELIAEHKADMLVAVPTMLHRMVELGPEVIAKYDTSSLKAIADRRVGPDPRDLSNRVQDTFRAMSSTTSTAYHRVRIRHRRHPRSSCAAAPGTAGRAPVTSECGPVRRARLGASTAPTGAAGSSSAARAPFSRDTPTAAPSRSSTATCPAATWVTSTRTDCCSSTAATTT